MTPEEFRTAGHALIDWIADHRERVPELPVQADVRPGQIRDALPKTPPEHGEAFQAVLEDLDDVVVPGLTQVQSPNSFAWFPSNATLASVLGDLASGGLGALGLTWQSAPALTEVEVAMTDWMRSACGLSEAWHGAIHDTASTSTLVALLAARERSSGYSAAAGGLQAQQRPLIVYCTAQAHSSVAKAAALAGFGLDNLHQVRTDPVTFEMDVADLSGQLRADLATGAVPAAIVATSGSTTTTSFDPIPLVVTAIDEFTEATGAVRPWLHVDAAMAGSALLLPECRPLFGGVGAGTAGIELADSIVWNPHKWLGTILDCSLLYVRDPDHLVRVMSTNPSYLRSVADDELARAGVPQYKDWGIPLGRRFRSLKLWFHLRLDGLEPIRERLRRDLANAAWLAEQVRAEPEWRLMAPVPLQTLCLAHEPAGLSAAELDEHNRAWAHALNASGRALVTPALLDGRWTIRVSIGVEGTERSHVERLWTLARETAIQTIQ